MDCVPDLARIYESRDGLGYLFYSTQSGTPVGESEMTDPNYIPHIVIGTYGQRDAGLFNDELLENPHRVREKYGNLTINLNTERFYFAGRQVNYPKVKRGEKRHGLLDVRPKFLKWLWKQEFRIWSGFL